MMIIDNATGEACADVRAWQHARKQVVWDMTLYDLREAVLEARDIANGEFRDFAKADINHIADLAFVMFDVFERLKAAESANG